MEINFCIIPELNGTRNEDFHINLGEHNLVPQAGMRVWLPLYEENKYEAFEVDFLDWDPREPNKLNVHVNPDDLFNPDLTDKDFLAAGWKK